MIEIPYALEDFKILVTKRGSNKPEIRYHYESDSLIILYPIYAVTHLEGVLNQVGWITESIFGEEPFLPLSVYEAYASIQEKSCKIDDFSEVSF